MEKKSQVHMLPTDKPFEWSKGQIVKRNNGSIDLSTHNVFNASAPSTGQVGQHLYFTTTEEIKGGDWVLINSQHVREAKTIENEKYLTVGQDNAIFITNCEKIVATTNKKLWGVRFEVRDNYNSRCYGQYKVGRIGEDFIGDYIKTYNKHSPITEVMLECETDIQTEPSTHEGSPCSHVTGVINIIKLRSNGTCIISPVVEKTFTLKELRDTTFLAFIAGFANPNLDPIDLIPFHDDWFNKNFINKIEIYE